MNLKSLSNHELTAQLKDLVGRERQTTTEILHHLREVERRRLYAERGYPSLIAYCMEELKYSESASYRRIQSMRLLAELPEIEVKIRTGELTLTTVAQTASFFKQLKERENKSPTRDEKIEVLKSVENLSRRETEKVLACREPDLHLPPRENQRTFACGTTSVTLTFEPDEMALFAEIRNLKADSGPLKHLVLSLARKELERLRKSKGADTPITHRKKRDASSSRSTPPAVLAPKPVDRRRPPQLRTSIPMSTKQLIWQKAQGRCEFRDPITGKSCEAKFGLQFDHLQPVALGGTNKPENLQLLCAAHNKLRALRTFGRSHALRHKAFTK